MAHAKRPGRRLTTDPSADETLFSQWLAARSQGISRADFAKGLSISIEELEKVIDRHRGRVKAAEKGNAI